MREFKVRGRGADSGRKRKPQIFAAASEAAATKLALQRGIAAETVEPLSATHIVLDVVGFSHNNEDGSNRQKIILSCRAGDRLVLERESGNRYDKHAIRVVRPDGTQVGYIDKENAKRLCACYDLDAGASAAAWVWRVVPPGERFGYDTFHFIIMEGIIARPEATSADIAAALEGTRVGKEMPTGWSVPPMQRIATVAWAPSTRRARPARKSAKGERIGCATFLLVLLVAYIIWSLFS